jgi:hypothetical protein
METVAKKTTKGNVEAVECVIKVIAEQRCGGAEKLLEAIAEGDVKAATLLQASHFDHIY